MTDRTGPFRVTMLDASVGNDYSISLCSGLTDDGVNVELITPLNRVVNIPANYEIKYWMPTKDTANSKAQKIVKYFKYLIRMFFYTARKGPQKRIIHFQFFRVEKIECILYFLLRLLGVKLVFTAHNVLPHENNRLDYLPRWLIYQSSNVVIVHSEYIKKKLMEKFPIREDKIQVIPCGHCDHYVPEHPISKEEARAKLGLAHDDRVLLFFGFIRPYKGLDFLLDAFELCSKDDERLKLVIAGAAQTAEMGKHFQQRVAQISRNGSIVYHPGFIPFDEVAKYFIAADIAVLPYKDIDHSAIFHLAYSFGRPIIATNVGDFPEVIENGKSGYVIPENTASCLAQTIASSFTDGGNLEDMGRYARALSETRYSWSGIAKQTRALYERI